MAKKHHEKDERDLNGRLLNLVHWECRERYVFLRLHPFMVRTPSISRRKGQCV
jgi:hypothetical protein